MIYLSYFLSESCVVILRGGSNERSQHKFLKRTNRDQKISAIHVVILHYVRAASICWDSSTSVFNAILKHIFYAKLTYLFPNFPKIPALSGSLICLSVSNNHQHKPEQCIRLCAPYLLLIWAYTAEICFSLEFLVLGDFSFLILLSMNLYKWTWLVLTLEAF